MNLSKSQSSRPPIDKLKVAKSFGDAAAHYDQLAEAQKRIAGRLLNLCPKAEHILDIGCGTGYWTRQLRDHCQAKQVIGLDLAQGMLDYAQKVGDNATIQWLCADAEQLPLPEQSLNLIFSSLAIQWCENTPALFAGIHRSLKKGGQAFIATLVPGTLSELAHSWAQVDQAQHVNQFIPSEVLIEQLQAQDLTVLNAEQYTETLYYPDLKAVFASIKGIGAHHVQGENHLTGRQALLKLKAAYEQQRTDQGLPVSYQVLILHLQR